MKRKSPLNCRFWPQRRREARNFSRFLKENSLVFAPAQRSTAADMLKQLCRSGGRAKSGD
jgi:hypothetical protein